MRNLGDKVGITGEIVGVENVNGKLVYKVAIPDYYESFGEIKKSSDDKILVPWDELFDLSKKIRGLN